MTTEEKALIYARYQARAEQYIKEAKEFYESLESAGINTSTANIQRVPDDIPIIINNQVEVIRCGKL